MWGVSNSEQVDIAPNVKYDNVWLVFFFVLWVPLHNCYNWKVEYVWMQHCNSTEPTCWEELLLQSCLVQTVNTKVSYCEEWDLHVLIATQCWSTLKHQSMADWLISFTSSSRYQHKYTAQKVAWNVMTFFEVLFIGAMSSHFCRRNVTTLFY